MANKDGISVEETRALLEGMEGAHQALSTAELREAADPLARAYLALSEREAVKDAEIARKDAALNDVRDWLRYELPPGTPSAAVMLRCVNAALTKGQVDG